MLRALLPSWPHTSLQHIRPANLYHFLAVIVNVTSLVQDFSKAREASRQAYPEEWHARETETSSCLFLSITTSDHAATSSRRLPRTSTWSLALTCTQAVHPGQHQTTRAAPSRQRFTGEITKRDTLNDLKSSCFAFSRSQRNCLSGKTRHIAHT